MTPQKAREYVKLFSTYIMPGSQWIERTDQTRIYFDKMDDAQAIFVAKALQDIETKSAIGAKKVLQ